MELNAVKEAVSSFPRKYGSTALSVGLAMGVVVFGMDAAFAADPPAVTPSVDVGKIIDDAKLIVAGALTLGIVLFGLKLWKRVFGGG